jgi:hypothetical protein
MIPHAAEDLEPGHAGGLEDLTHCEVGCGLRCAEWIEEALGATGEGLAAIVSVRRGRDHGDDAFRQGEKIG